MTARATLPALLFAAACGTPGGAVDDTGQVPARDGTTVVAGCQVTPGQQATLASADTRRVLSNVVLLCLAAQPDGGVVASDGSGAPALAAQAAALKALGYGVRWGLSLQDGNGQVPDPPTATAMLGDEGPTGEAWRQAVTQTLASLPIPMDGWELALPQLEAEARLRLTLLAADLYAAPNRPPFAIWIPPSTQSPSDVDGGDAYDVGSLAQLSDRLRVMTLDYSSSSGWPGPTIDPGWAVDAVQFAASENAGALDVAVPLYGTRFDPGSTQAISYPDAVALAQQQGAAIVTEATGVEHFAFGQTEVWFDDATSTRRTLAAWQPSVLDPSVGVLFWGLGAEDPSLWQTVSEAMP